MACESWKASMDAYVDGELVQSEMRAFDEHLRTCGACATEALARLQMKRAIHNAGRRFIPTAEFRKRIQQSISRSARGTFGLRWAFAVACVALAVAASLYLVGLRSRANTVYGEITDLHATMLASSSPVDVISSDRHTVKPWFQGKIPFTFDLPELQSSGFSLLGGRVVYLEHASGAELIYEIRKHRISVFIFPESALRSNFPLESKSTRSLSFNLETWSRGGLRYFLIGDCSRSDVNQLADLFRKAGE